MFGMSAERNEVERPARIAQCGHAPEHNYEPTLTKKHLRLLNIKAIPHKDSAADAPAQSLRSRVSFGNNYHSDR